MPDRRQPPTLGTYRPTAGRADPRLPTGAELPRVVTQARRPVRTPPRRSRGGMTAAIVGLAVLAVILAGGMVALYLASPTALVRDELARQVKLRTGRDLSIAGPTRLGLWGVMSVRLGDVALSAPPGMGGPPLVRMRELVAELAVWPLVRGQVIVDRIVLVEPRFDLRIDGAGRRSWEFAGSPPRLPIEYAQATGQIPPELADFLANSSKDAKVGGASRPRPAVGELSIGEVHIVGGSAQYTDARSAISETADAIELGIVGRSLIAPVEANGTMRWRGETVAVTARLASPAAVLEGRNTRLTATAAIPNSSVAYDGQLNQAATGMQLDGTLKVDAAALRETARWLGLAIPPLPGAGRLVASGDLKTQATAIQFSRAAIQIDSARAEGSVTVDLAGPRPSIRADATINGLDLDALIPDGASSDGPRAVPASIPRQTPLNAEKGLSIDDILRRESGGTRVKGFVRRTGWSEEPFSSAALAAADVEAKLTLGRIKLQGISVDSAALRLTLRNRVLNASFEDVRLYEGRGRGVITVDATNPALVKTGLNVSAEGVAGRPLLADAGGFDWLEGKTRIQIALGGQGATERAIVESLNGRAEFAFADGAIVGIDVAKLLRDLAQGRFGGFERRLNEKTPFSELAASFRITGGVAETKDIRMIGPDVRLAGAGTSDLGKRLLDASLKPRVITSATQPDSGFEIPLRLSGTWDAPRLAPDLDAVLKDPSKTVEAVRELVRRPGVSEGVKGVLDAVQSGDSRTAKERARGLLDQFLKR